MLSSECYLIRDQIYKYHYTKEDRRCTVLFYLYYYSATVPDLLFTTRVLKEKLHTIINYTIHTHLVWFVGCGCLTITTLLNLTKSHLEGRMILCFGERTERR